MLVLYTLKTRKLSKKKKQDIKTIELQKHYIDSMRSRRDQFSLSNHGTEREL